MNVQSIRQIPSRRRSQVERIFSFVVGLFATGPGTIMMILEDLMHFCESQNWDSYWWLCLVVQGQDTISRPNAYTPTLSTPRGRGTPTNATRKALCSFSFQALRRLAGTAPARSRCRYTSSPIYSSSLVGPLVVVDRQHLIIIIMKHLPSFQFPRFKTEREDLQLPSVPLVSTFMLTPNPLRPVLLSFHHIPSITPRAGFPTSELATQHCPVSLLLLRAESACGPLRRPPHPPRQTYCLH